MESDDDDDPSCCWLAVVVVVDCAMVAKAMLARSRPA